MSLQKPIHGEEQAMPEAESSAGSVSYSLPDLVLYFFKLGAIGFGGPVALAYYMERDLISRKKWLTQEEYLRGLALTQLAPGSWSLKLAVYFGYLKYRWFGAALAGAAFFCVPFFVVLALGMLYVAYGQFRWTQALLYGVNAAVIGIIGNSAYRLVKQIIKPHIFFWGVFTVMFCITAYMRQGSALLIILSGIIAVLVFAPPRFGFSRKLHGIAFLPLWFLNSAIIPSKSLL